MECETNWQKSKNRIHHCMSRPYRLQAEGLLYHITSRGDDRKKIAREVERLIKEDKRIAEDAEIIISHSKGRHFVIATAEIFS